MNTYREACARFERMEISEQVYEVQTTSKKILRHMTTVTFMSGKEREEKPPCLTTPRRDVVVSTRQKTQYIQVKRQTVQKNCACCMAPDTPLRGVNYLRDTPKSTPCSSHIKIMKPAPTAKKSS